MASEDRSTVLQYLLNENIDDNLILFYGENGMLTNDISINELQLSARAKGCLMRAGVYSVRAILHMHYEDLENLKGLGRLSLDNIMSCLKARIIANNEKNDFYWKSEALLSLLKKNFADKCPDLDCETILSHLRRIFHLRGGNLEHHTEENWNDNEVLRWICDEPKMKQLLKCHIQTKVIQKGDVKRDEINGFIPDFFVCFGKLDMLLYELEAECVIECENGIFREYVPDVLTAAKTIRSPRKREALLYRLKGLTLETIGEKLGVTRERVRQMINDAIRELGEVKEDSLKYWFEKYEMKKEEFLNIFETTEEGYHFLRLTASKGTNSIYDLLGDEKITRKIYVHAKEEIAKYCLIIGHELVPIKRECIEKKLLELHYSDCDGTISEFYKVYTDFLKKNYLDAEEKLQYPSLHALEARLADRDYALLKYGKRIRYYDLKKYDIDFLFSELGFEQYSGMELSTLKLFISHELLMQEYNILDEYELHNIMKKSPDNLRQYHVELGRMPLFSVGTTDRATQVTEFLYRVAPIGVYDFGAAYEEEYGVKSETVLANFVQYINHYYHNSFLAVDQPKLGEYEFDILQHYLDKDFYFIDDIKEIYRKLFNTSEDEKINAYTLKCLGYQVFTTYVLRMGICDSAEQYFRNMLRNKQFIDLWGTDKRLLNLQTFNCVLNRFRKELLLVEYLPNKFINLDVLRENVEPQLLYEYGKTLIQYATGNFFTIHSLRMNGFDVNLPGIEYGDWFYASLVRIHSEIQVKRLGGNLLFKETENQITLTDFIIFLVEEQQKFVITDLLQFVKKNYDMELDKAKTLEMIKSSRLYFSPALNTVFASYEDFITCEGYINIAQIYHVSINDLEDLIKRKEEIIYKSTITLTQILYDMKFKSFVEYCAVNGVYYLKDLLEFDFEKVKEEGFCDEKVMRVIIKELYRWIIGMENDTRNDDSNENSLINMFWAF